MGTYFDKKKLLEENDDLYISGYDKNLDIGSLSQIIDAKKEYKAAEAAGDKYSMLKANNRANSVRHSAGRYDGGDDGSEYNRMYKNYETDRPADYKSKYKDEIDDAVSKISGVGEFEYNPEEDPLYQNYKRIYLMLGDDAYERALAENALRTGGMVSTGAQSAAMQAKNEYNSMLAAKVPELYEIAYGKYRDDISGLYDRLEAMSELDSEEYSRYRDTVDDFETDREYFYGVEKDYADALYDMYKDDSDMEYKLTKDSMETAYKKERDEIEDARWDTEFNYKKERDAVKDGQWNSEMAYNRSRDAAKDSQWSQEFEYNKSRDAIKDDQWNQEFEYDKTKDFNELYMDKLQAAINLAKTLYGKVPIGYGTINSLLSMIN